MHWPVHMFVYMKDKAVCCPVTHHRTSVLCIIHENIYTGYVDLCQVSQIIGKHFKNWTAMIYDIHKSTSQPDNQISGWSSYNLKKKADCTFMLGSWIFICIILQIEVASQPAAVASVLLQLFYFSPFHFQSLTHWFLCVFVFIFPLTCFDMTSMYSILVSVLSFKQWCQAKGMFCFSFAQKQLN